MTTFAYCSGNHTATFDMWRNRMTAGLLSVLMLTMTGWAATAAKVTTVPSGRSDLALFLYEGPVEEGDTLKLTQAVSNVPHDKTVALILDSGGGAMTEGIALGRFIYKQQISTYVISGGLCASACSMAFLAGRDKSGRPSRTKTTSSRLGFHQFYLPINADNANAKFNKADMENRVIVTHKMLIDIIGYLEEIGEGYDKFDLMLSKPGTDLRDIQNEEAATLGFNVLNANNASVIEASNIRARTK